MRENIVETWAYYHLPVAHHKHLKSTNMLERFHQEIKHRTLVVRIFPNAPSYLRLVRAPLAAGTHENWIEATRYLNMDLLIEHKKQLLRNVEAAWMLRVTRIPSCRTDTHTPSTATGSFRGK